MCIHSFKNKLGVRQKLKNEICALHSIGKQCVFVYVGPKNITIDAATNIWICTSCGIHGYILISHMNKHTLLNNVM